MVYIIGHENMFVCILVFFFVFSLVCVCGGGVGLCMCSSSEIVVVRCLVRVLGSLRWFVLCRHGFLG